RNPRAADLVRHSAFMAPEAIPEEILSSLDACLGKPSVARGKFGRWFETIEEAGRFGLIRRDPRTNTISVHRLSQEVIRGSMDKVTQKGCVQRILRTIADVFPSDTLPDWDRCARYAQHVGLLAHLAIRHDVRDQFAGNLFIKCGSYLSLRAQYGEAER